LMEQEAHHLEVRDLRLGPDDVLRAPTPLLRRAFTLLREDFRSRFQGKMKFYAPGFVRYESSFFDSRPAHFPSISVTGRQCSLNCLHCRGRILETMIPATSPDTLYAICRGIREEGGEGCLISGGCLPDGSVPLNRFVEAIGRIKSELGLAVVVHTGLIGREEAIKLAEAGVDAALIDVLGSDETIREVYRLNASVEDYETALSNLEQAGLPIVPHVLVGLHYGELRGEARALEIIARHNPRAVVVIALMPIPGTPMEDVEPPPPIDIARVIAAARILMPDTPIALGCARPKGLNRIKTDCLAVSIGVNAVAFPSEEAVNLASRLGYQWSFSHKCCSQIFKDLP
jgi:uncharacterized radical SAM superfamily protein